MKRYNEEKRSREEAKAEAKAKAKVEQQAILDKYPRIGILHQTNPQFSRTDPNATVMQIVFYVWSKDGAYVESADLSKVVEAISGV